MFLFYPLNLGLMLITQFSVLVIFGYIWEERVFLKGLVKLGEIRYIEDLM